MDLPALIELNLTDRTATLNLGFIKFTNIPLSLAKQLSHERPRIRRIVDRSVIRRRAMWDSFERERADDLAQSLADLETDLDIETEALGNSSRKSDETLACILRAWAQEACDARKKIRDAIRVAQESERELDRDEWWEPHEDARPIIAQFRTKVYPAALAIVEMLEKSDVVRVKAEALLAEGSDRLIRFGVSTRTFDSHGWFIESDAARSRVAD